MYKKKKKRKQINTKIYNNDNATLKNLKTRCKEVLK